MRQIVNAYPDARKIHLVMDNLSTHTKTSLVAAFGCADADRLWNRIQAHYTPKHGSWLNQAEIEISLVSRECLGRRRLGSLVKLKEQTCAWNRLANRDRRTIEWRFTRRKARETFRHSTNLSRVKD